MTTTQWALLFHLLGALVFVGGTLVAGVAFEAARRRDDPREIAVVLGLARWGVLLVAIGLPVLLGFGLWLVQLEGLSWDTLWIRASVLLFAGSVLLGGAGGRAPKRARKLAESGAVSAEELRRLLGEPLALTLNYLSAALAVAILVLMVWKPS